MKKIPDLLEMLKSGMHFGHLTSKWHPKMKPYIFTERNNIHIINLEETRTKLAEALDFVREQAKMGKVILFLGSKKQAQASIEKYAKECGMPYVIHRWIGGTITNFQVVIKVIKKLNDMRRKKAAGDFEKYTKKEQLLLEREIERLENLVGGMSEVTKVPDVLFIVDVKDEKTAVVEGRKKGVKIVAICDTNVNPVNIDYVIPANDDALKSIEMVTSLISQAVKEGKEQAATAAEEKKVI